MKILCTGTESAGTKLISSLLRQAGAEVIHSSPHYLLEQKGKLHSGIDFDAVVLIVRSYYPNYRSILDNGHAGSKDVAKYMVPSGMYEILAELWKNFSLRKVYIITYEGLVHEPESLEQLCDDLRLDYSKITDTIGNGNAKYYGGEHFSDRRELHDRK